MMDIILKSGERLEAVEIDWNNPVVKLQIEQAKKEIDRILDLKKIDYEKLRITFMTV